MSVIPGFSTPAVEDRDILGRPNHGILYSISGHANVQFGDSYISANRVEPTFDSLRIRLNFPYMDTRTDQITDAFPETYGWILSDSVSQMWDPLPAWLSRRDVRPIYWIRGKPGSGKSTVMKYLSAQRTLEVHASKWTSNKRLVKLSYYFWIAGNELQQSLEGFCRSSLRQILRSCPQASGIISEGCENLDLRSPNTLNTVALCRTLLDTVRAVTQEMNVVFFIDGLDECSAGPDGQEKLLALIESLSRLENIKIIAASRPENIFRDAFYECPCLQLELLTRGDIESYVLSRLHSNRIWRSHAEQNLDLANEITRRLVLQAEGVFLWVVLSVGETFRSLQEGEAFEDVHNGLSNLPKDLNEFFACIMHSILPEYQREASTLLQMALYQETGFTPITDFCLLDTNFVYGYDDDFVLQNNFKFPAIEIHGIRRLRNRLDLARRRLQSRCKGLLQCADVTNSSYDRLETPFGRTEQHAFPLKSDQNLEDEVLASTAQMLIIFLHRSVRDFLRLPQQEQILYAHTEGVPIRVRRRINNARIAQLIALDSNDLGDLTAVGVASHVLAAIAADEADGNDFNIYQLTALVAPHIEKLAVSRESAETDHCYYIDTPFEEWRAEESNFLSLAIDFGIHTYVEVCLTADAIQSKRGRPLLDHILQPCFNLETTPSFYGCVSPNLVRRILSLGANPNASYAGSSIWARYLCFLANDILQENEFFMHEIAANFAALQLLLNSNCARSLPVGWLGGAVSYSAFQKSWPLSWEHLKNCSELNKATMIPVSVLLEDLKWLSSENLRALQRIISEDN